MRPLLIVIKVPGGDGPDALEQHPGRAPDSALHHISARSRRLNGRNHMNDHEQLCDEHGVLYTEEEQMALAAAASIAAEDARVPPPLLPTSAPPPQQEVSVDPLSMTLPS